MYISTDEFSRSRPSNTSSHPYTYNPHTTNYRYAPQSTQQSSDAEVNETNEPNDQVTMLDDEEVARVRAPETIRKLFVDVVMTMLKYGDINVKKSLLEVKGLVGPLFKGLVDDPARMAGPMLATLCTSVLEDRAVGRRAKLSLFNQTVVGYLLECYRSENEVLAQVVHDFNKRLFVDQQSSPFGLGMAASSGKSSTGLGGMLVRRG
jgi:hypothetical protein